MQFDPCQRNSRMVISTACLRFGKYQLLRISCLSFIEYRNVRLLLLATNTKNDQRKIPITSQHTCKQLSGQRNRTNFGRVFVTTCLYLGRTGHAKDALAFALRCDKHSRARMQYCVCTAIQNAHHHTSRERFAIGAI